MRGPGAFPITYHLNPRTERWRYVVEELELYGGEYPTLMAAERQARAAIQQLDLSVWRPRQDSNPRPTA